MYSTEERVLYKSMCVLEKSSTKILLKNIPQTQCRGNKNLKFVVEISIYRFNAGKIKVIFFLEGCMIYIKQERKQLQ
jgi:hypothetical protein